MLRRLLLHSRQRRRYSSAAATVPLSTPTFAVFGANTGVGKTLVSAGLTAALLNSPSPSVSAVAYLKPLQTGFPADSDARFVFSRTPALLRASSASSSSPRATRLVASCSTLFPSPPVGAAAEPLHKSQEKVVTYGGDGAPEETKVLSCRTVYAWREPVSPHLAAEREGMAAGDDEVRGFVEQWLLEEGIGNGGEVWKVLETAGGVASPGASGTLQCDLYRSVPFTACCLFCYGFLKHALFPFLMPFRLPAILVGDGRLGGISSTLSAYETLLLRGFAFLTIHMQRKSKDLLWWPFTQHNLVPQDSVTVIDSRCGENFSAYKIELARDMGYAAARYGHVMFPENVHEPALRAAEVLLGGVGKGGTRANLHLEDELLKRRGEVLWTGPFRPVIDRNNRLDLLLKGQVRKSIFGIMADLERLVGCGAQDCFSSEGEVFCKSRDKSSVSDLYLSYIKQQLSEFSVSSNSEHIAALIIEPVIQGAGGMLMIDPLFQRILVSECRSRKIPVIFDEVFTGFWRLGVESASELLGCLPDIACYAKLMTGGIVPLAATLATEEVFESFRSDSKLTALLHGHSYTAHAMGCAAALKAIQWYQDPSTNLNLDTNHMKLKELWDGTLVNQLSSLPNVKRVISIGTLCAIELKAEGSDAGYVPYGF
ncbi:hypothetical protein HU200_033697 [Digitaria exilis]|uniref:Bifunctional dethiobiotin synthetase/7,8-diamino-pelargonic acid aminotransferase, mitochondrial n=1 Tax=Digitaria exilis TaxID=1010633 RepID=A0A835EPG7_9POAL|nr:hypothetical protein HU200_033697 [Digitaria exilis]